MCAVGLQIAESDKPEVTFYVMKFCGTYKTVGVISRHLGSSSARTRPAYSTTKRGVIYLLCWLCHRIQQDLEQSLRLVFNNSNLHNFRVRVFSSSPNMLVVC